MSRELRTLMSQLEAERDSIIAFTDEIERQVNTGILTRELADELIRREFNGRNPRDLLVTTNEHIARARELLASQRTVSSPVVIAPIAIVLVLSLALIWNFGTITGFFTASGGETFYAIPLNQTTIADTTIPLAISDAVSSLRVDGEISGTGTARVLLEQNGHDYLIASFDAHRQASPLTGNVIAGDGSVLDNLTANATENATLNATDNVTTPVGDTNSTNSTNETNATEPTAPITLPSTPQPVETPTSPAIVAPVTQPLESACVETCALPDLSGPFTLKVIVDGGTTVRLDRLVYGTYVGGRPVAGPTNANVTSSVNDSNASNQTNTTVVIPPENVSSNASSPTITPPANTTVPVFGQVGAVCTAATDCASGVCRESRFHGVNSSRVCVPDATACVADTTVYAPSDTLNDSVCIAGTGGSAWIVREGRGRFAIQDSAGSIAAIIDKYGTMAVRGTALFGVAPATDGWLVKDAAGAVQLSIAAGGELRTAGNLTVRTTPSRTGSGDFVIATTQGVDAAVITQHGDIALTGDFLSGAAIQ